MNRRNEINDSLGLMTIMENLSKRRRIFHSEADFQFALAWEIQKEYPQAEVRLEYPSVYGSAKRIDIVVWHKGNVYPIELKYPKRNLSIDLDGEQYILKSSEASDNEKYALVKDIVRMESFSSHLKGYKQGYVICLTNDHAYWMPPTDEVAGYAAFNVYEGARKAGIMAWGSRAGAGTRKGQEAELVLKGEYDIHWNDYSDVGGRSGLFRFMLLSVDETSNVGAV